jgi:uncharacterized protein YcbX
VAARVARISIAPVKALGLVHPDEVELGPRGVEGNRRFWLVEADGRLVSNKKHRTLMLVRPEWDEQTRELALTFPDGTRVEGTVELGDDLFDQSMYSHPVKSRHVFGPWEDALSRFASEPLTLLWAEEGAPDRLYAGTATIVSRESVARLAEVAGEKAIDPRRFRMTFDIEGVAPHEEDSWIGSEVRLGEATVKVHGDVGRCAITTLDPDSAEPTVDTLKALAAYRKEGVKEPLPLGVYASVVAPGRVRIGDDIASSLS